MATKKPESNMRVPLQSIVVVRDGKQMSPPIGVPFEFTKDEIDQVMAMNPDALTTKATVDVTDMPAPGGDQEV